MEISCFSWILKTKTRGSNPWRVLSGAGSRWVEGARTFWWELHAQSIMRQASFRIFFVSGIFIFFKSYHLSLRNQAFVDWYDCTFRISMVNYLWGVDWILDLSKCRSSGNKIIETDVLFLMLACICHHSWDTADLEVAVCLCTCRLHPQPVSETKWEWERTGRGCEAVLRGGGWVPGHGQRGDVFWGGMACNSLPSSQAASSLQQQGGAVRSPLKGHPAPPVVCVPSQTPLSPPTLSAVPVAPSLLEHSHSTQTYCLSLPTQRQPSRPPSVASTFPFLFFFP